MSEYFQPEREIYPTCKLDLDDDYPVWRYMDLKKFFNIIEQRVLYLCRADMLQDRFEGRYSYRQIINISDWLSTRGLQDVERSEAEYRERIRRQTYISCWCLGDCDYDLMWKAYVKNQPGIAIKSSVGALKEICDQNVEYWPLDISVVTYYDQAGGGEIGYDRLTPFIYKDSHFRLDTEIRIIHWPNMQDPTPSHVDLPVLPDQFIHGVILSPRSSESEVRNVKEVLDNHSFNRISVGFSRDDRPVVQ